MRNLRIIIISLFLIVSVAFTAFFFYNTTMTDRTAPMIICDGVPLYISIDAPENALCSGLTATDDVDGDITDKIIVRKISQLVGDNSAMIYYAVFDSSSNFCTYTRTVYYTDYHKPHFSLSKPLSYNTNGIVYLEDRLTARDTLDGDITNKIRVSSSSVNNTVPGDYPITIQVTNSNGDTAAVTLMVRIESTDTRQPIISLTDYIVYVDYESELTDDMLRSYIRDVQKSYAGGSVSRDKVDILSNVDTSARGSYYVNYSFTNDGGYTSSVLLNVIVE